MSTKPSSKTSGTTGDSVFGPQMPRELDQDERGQNKSAFTMWVEEVSAPICTVVPGRAQLAGMVLPFFPDKQ